jgi:hypothetical protein
MRSVRRPIQASLLAPYGNPEALAVAGDLDLMVEALLKRAAA